MWIYCIKKCFCLLSLVGLPRHDHRGILCPAAFWWTQNWIEKKRTIQKCLWFTWDVQSSWELWAVELWGLLVFISPCDFSRNVICKVLQPQSLGALAQVEKYQISPIIKLHDSSLSKTILADIYHVALPCHSIVSRSPRLFHWAVRVVAKTARNCGSLSSLDALWVLLMELFKRRKHTQIQTIN